LLKLLNFRYFWPFFLHFKKGLSFVPENFEFQNWQILR